MYCCTMYLAVDDSCS
uniref:Uncharacterized protein n=1 Tax=Arundo donax TaxID=35708 RepID=A0A0A9C071_ARUDO